MHRIVMQLAALGGAATCWLAAPELKASNASPTPRIIQNVVYGKEAPEAQVLCAYLVKAPQPSPVLVQIISGGWNSSPPRGTNLQPFQDCLWERMRALVGVGKDPLTVEELVQKLKPLSPIEYVTKNSPPVFLTHVGPADAFWPGDARLKWDVHTPITGLILAKKLKELGVPHELVILPEDAGRGGAGPFLEKELAFLRRHLGFTTTAQDRDRPRPVAAVEATRRTERGAMSAVVMQKSSTTQVSTTGELSLTDRIAGRTFPSVFQAWNAAENVDDPSPLHTVARHDLVFHGPQFFGLRWSNRFIGLADGFSPESIENARAFRRKLLELNPRLVLLAEIRYRDAAKNYLPDGHPWWLRDAEGRMVSGWDEGGFFCLNFHDAGFRSQVVKQAKAAVDSGLVDGVMLDWWSDDASRLALVKELRQAVGDGALIMANANDRTTPQTAPYINGYFMECYKSQTAEDWKQIADTLAWAEEHLQPPRMNCLETWFHKSRDDLHLMRATTTLALTCSDGYCLFSDPNPLPKPDHLHNWYPFWNKSLGRPTAKGQKFSDGTERREFEKGTVVYNPMGNKPVSVTFPQTRVSLVTGETTKVHRLDSPDGDIYLATPGNGL